MDKTQIINAIVEARSKAQKRNFKQSVDFLIVCKEIDLKKNENQFDLFLMLPHGTGKKKSICALVAQELLETAKESCDEVIPSEEFQKYAQDKKLVRKLAKKHDFFIAQANIMPQVATAFGKVLGPKGKMPNPKAGCVIPPKTNIKPLYDKLQNTVKASLKTAPVIKCVVGLEDMDDNAIAENILFIFDNVVNRLPSGEANIKKMIIKLTMSPVVPIAVGSTEAVASSSKKKARKAKPAAAPKKTEEKVIENA